ncbi:protein FAR1-RELATED SEQUENCE 5-like [Telopea speciosissima]|uniref:protein FAR1-RELATED SEQUENCE 5-like n=1 Tax=Telopea speciosissima TaxID=54955 RepID=UPI001CC4CA17|nr:protein FAR1-RELATED SEQUENCE 5-like [Telopea speciosissima]
MATPNIDIGHNDDSKPRIDMEFNSDNEAFEFYNSYGGRVGFSVKKELVNKSKKDKSTITSRSYVCSKEGIREKDKRRDHNHELHTPSTTDMMRSQWIISDIQTFEIGQGNASRIRPKAMFGYMGKQAGGRQTIGYIPVDHYNYLRSKRQCELRYGEAGRRIGRWVFFSGFNHHKGVVIFEAAILYDETIESFKWLFETFLESHAQKKPITFFTDQDAAMAKAISKVFIGIWHDLQKCIYHYDEEVQYETAWEQLRSRYQVENGSWLDRIYGLKKKWVKCYMKNTFTRGMRSTQLSESINADLKDYTKCTLDVVQFMKHFERVVNDKHANELKADFESRNKLPKNLFRYEEYKWVGYCYIKQKDESDSLHKYVVCTLDSADVEYKVVCNPYETMVECSCRKFELFGILYCHALKILDMLDIKSIPEAYIMSRWTRVARNMAVEDNSGIQVEKDANLDRTQRYRMLCRKLVKIALQASTSVEGYALVNNVASDLCKQLDNLSRHAPNLNQDESTEEVNLNIAKGLKRNERKKKGGSNPSRQIKSCTETKGKRKKIMATSTSLSLPTHSQLHSQASISQENVDLFASQSSCPPAPLDLDS